MPNCKAQVILPSVTGLPSDVFINTFHFATSANDAAVGANIVAKLVAFYDIAQSSASVGSYLGGTVSRDPDAAMIKLYDEAANDLPPFYEDTFTVDAAGNPGDLPWEVACCLSFKNTSVTSSPERNRRGRVYIGPLTVGARVEVDGSVRPHSLFITDLLDAGEQLVADNNAQSTWVVWSPTLGFSFPVEAGWVDNAFDTQRRRGEAATSRTSRTF